MNKALQTNQSVKTCVVKGKQCKRIHDVLGCYCKVCGFVFHAEQKPQKIAAKQITIMDLTQTKFVLPKLRKYQDAILHLTFKEIEAKDKSKPNEYATSRLADAKKLLRIARKEFENAVLAQYDALPNIEKEVFKK